MSWSTLRGVLMTLVLVASAASAAKPAWARRAKSPPKEERLEPPDAPPPSFIAPPPGYEPPPPYEPGDPSPPPPAYEEPMPNFITLDRVDASPRAGAQAGWHKIDDVDAGDAFLFRLEPYGQYVLPGLVGGFYGQLPLVHRVDLGGDDATAVGNLELGGFYLPRRSSELILRGGIAAGIASDGAASSLANLQSGLERLTDFVLAGPRYTTLRLSASTVRRWDVLSLRADLGFDAVLNKPSAYSDATSVFGRGNVALGVRAGGVDFTFELANLAAFNGSAVPSGLTNHLFHTVALGVRTPGVDQFHFGLVFPLDEATRGDAWIVSLGYQRAGTF